MRAYLQQVGVIIWKDLLTELRTGRRFVSMAGFAVLVGVLFNYSIDPGVIRPRDFFAAILWLTVVFGGMLGLQQTFALELENGAIEGLLLTPIARDALYLGKVASNFALVMMLVAFVVAVFALFFSVGLGPHPGTVALLLSAGTLGFVAIGTLFSAITVRSSMRETLLPILVFPLLVPMIYFGASGTSRLLGGLPPREVEGNLRLLLAFALLGLVSGAGLFRFVVEDT